MEHLTYDQLFARLDEAIHQRETGLVDADADLFFSSARRIVSLQREMRKRIMAKPVEAPEHEAA